MYEKLWHLIVPPLMAVMDDYEVYYKLQGVEIVLAMVERGGGADLRG